MNAPDVSQYILRMPNVEQKVGLKKTSIYQLIKENKFPAPVRLTNRSVGWYSNEINDWLLSRQRAEL